MKTALIWALVFILLINGVIGFGSWCYQESANVSNQGGLDGSCSLNYSGIYGFAGSWVTSQNNLIDGDWATSAQKIGPDAYLYINYTKPPNSLNTSLWQIKDGGGTKNLTIPQDCWIYNDTRLIFFAGSASTGSYFYCYNSSTLTLQLLWHNASMTTIYEESMWWYVNIFNANVGLYNERTSLPINTTWNLELWNSIARNYTVIGTNLSIINLTFGGLYNLKYFVDGYATRNIYITISANTQYQKLYVLNSSNVLLTQYTVTDLSALPIVAATISVYRKMMSSNAWELVEQSISDQNGQGSLSLEPYTANYRFIITDSSGNTIFTSVTPQTISGNTIFFKSQVASNNMQSYWNMLNINHNISFANATSNLTFGWYDSSNSVVSASLVVYQINGLSNVLVCNSTVNTSTGSAICDLAAYRNDSSNTYHSQGLLWVNGSLYRVEVYDNNFASSSSLWGKSGAFLAMLIILILSCMGLWNPSAALVFAGIGVLISSWFGLIPLAYTWLAGLLALIAIAIWRMKT